VTGPRILDHDNATALPWQHPAVSSAPWAPHPTQAPAVPAMVPVAWAARVSDEEAQDPTLSLPRQLDRARAALPAGFVIVAHFFDVESGAFRKTIRDRFADIAGQIRRAEADRDALRPPATTPAADNADLIEQLPQIQLHLAQAPDELQRALYDAFDLTITYNRERHHATLKVTITADALDGLANTVHAVADRRADTQTSRSDSVSLVLCGPDRAPYERSVPYRTGQIVSYRQ